MISAKIDKIFFWHSQISSKLLPFWTFKNAFRVKLDTSKNLRSPILLTLRDIGQYWKTICLQNFQEFKQIAAFLNLWKRFSSKVRHFEESRKPNISYFAGYRPILKNNLSSKFEEFKQIAAFLNLGKRFSSKARHFDELRKPNIAYFAWYWPKFLKYFFLNSQSSSKLQPFWILENAFLGMLGTLTNCGSSI